MSRRLRIVLSLLTVAALSAGAAAASLAVFPRLTAAFHFRMGNPPSPNLDDIMRGLLPRPGSDPVDGQPWILVVGDSISAGFTVDPAEVGRIRAWPTVLESSLASEMHVTVVACPGQTAAGYARTCPLTDLEPWLRGRPLRQVAGSLIAAHRGQLAGIVVELGANDLFNARRDHVPLPRALDLLEGSVDTVVADLGSRAPGVPVVVTSIYDPYPASDVVALVAVTEADQRIASLAAERGATVADLRAAVDGGGDAAVCANVDCAHQDIHPTTAGHLAIAAEVRAALTRARVRGTEPHFGEPGRRGPG